MPQPELIPPTIRRHAKDAAWLTLHLSNRGWVRGADITRRSGWDERRLRNAAAASEGQILSGQQGYKLTLECTGEEVRRAANWLRSQAKKMTERSLSISRVFHRAASQCASRSVGQ